METAQQRVWRSTATTLRRMANAGVLASFDVAQECRRLLEQPLPPDVRADVEALLRSAIQAATTLAVSAA